MLSFGPLKKTCIALAIAQTLAIPAAQAATIFVNTTNDTDGNDQACTLREAILSIHDLNPASKGCTHSDNFGVNDTVNFDSGLNDQAIQLEQGSSLFITKDLIINGLGEDRLTIDRIGPESRIFRIDNAATVQINDLKITGGRTPDGGAGIYVHNNSNLTLSNVTVSGNITYPGGFDFDYGGGISAHDSSVTLNNCTVSGNSAASGGGISAKRYSEVSIIDSIVSGNSIGNSSSPFLRGGGIFVSYQTSVSLTNSSVSGNSGGDGGGIFATVTSSVSLTNSTVSGNFAGADGGGIKAQSSSIIRLTDSTVSGNSAVEYGGGIMSSLSQIHLINSTLSGNSANDSGGGILFLGNDPAHFMTLWHTTITNNTSGDDGGGIGMIGGIVRFTNSIVSGNISADLGDEVANFAGTFILDRNNLFGDSSNSNAQAFASFSPNPAGTDITATSNGTMPTTLASLLQTTLKNNGGPTQTHALVVGSPAVNGGNPFLCRATDQRGENRSDQICDIGSYEFIDNTCYVINTPANKTVVFCL